MNIKIVMRSGETRLFPHEGRPGGSYTKSIRYEGAFVIIRNEWGSETALPAADIAEVQTTENRF